MEEDPEIIESKNLIEICEYEKALQILENYAKKFPENIICTDLLADIYFKLGFDNKALRMFEKSAKKAPNENPDKYLSMAQLIVNPRERRQIYFKAVELYRKKISERDSSKKKKNTRRLILPFRPMRLSLERPRQHSLTNNNDGSMRGRRCRKNLRGVHM